MNMCYLCFFFNLSDFLFFLFILVISVDICAFLYVRMFMSFRHMESVRYLPTLTLKSNCKTIPVHFVKVDQGNLDFFHSLNYRKICLGSVESLLCMFQNTSFRPVNMVWCGVMMMQSCSLKLKQMFATDKTPSVLSFKCFFHHLAN